MHCASAASGVGVAKVETDLSTASVSTDTGGDGSDDGKGSGRNTDGPRATDEEDEPENAFSYTGWNPVKRCALAPNSDVPSIIVDVAVAVGSAQWSIPAERLVLK